MDIHLFEAKSKGIKPIDFDKHQESNTFDSYSWVVGDETAAQLEGGSVFFHKNKSSKSHFGGTIISTRRVPEEDNRLVIRFESDKTKEGVAPPHNWNRQDFVLIE